MEPGFAPESLVCAPEWQEQHWESPEGSGTFSLAGGVTELAVMRADSLL